MKKKGVKIVLYQDKQKEELFFGKTGPSSSGIYLRLGKKDEIYLIDDNLKNFVNLGDLRDLTILRTNSERIKKLTFKTKEGQFILEKKPLKEKKNENKWYLGDKEANQSKVTSYLTTISVVTAKDGFIDNNEEKTGIDNPQFVLTIDEVGQPTQTIKIGNMVKNEENSDYYLALKDSPIIYSISSTTFSDLLKTKIDFQ